MHVIICYNLIKHINLFSKILICDLTPNFVNKRERRNLWKIEKQKLADKDLSSWGGPGGTKFTKCVQFVTSWI